VRDATVLFDAAQAGAGVPETAGQALVVRHARGARLAAVDEVLAADAFHRGRRGQVDRGGGALLGGAEERAQQLRERGGEAAVVLPEARRDGAGVKAVGGDAGAVEAPGQLIGEEDVGELGGAVDPHGAVAPRVVEVVEVDPTEAVRVRGDVHDAGRGRCPQAREQEVRQQEVREVVHREHGLDPVHRGRAPEVHDAGVVHEHVDGRVAVAELGREPPDLRLRGEVGQEEGDGLATLSVPLYQMEQGQTRRD